MSGRNGAETGLSRARIIQAATDLVEREGLPALTMRRLGKVMNVDSAAFYYYFKDKAELLRAVGRMSIAVMDYPLEENYPDWREWLLAVGNAYRDQLVQHAYLRTLIQDGYVTWAALPFYALQRRQLLRERIPEDRHHFILESIHAFVMGSAVVTAHYHDADAPGAAVDERGVDAFLEQRRAEFDLAFRVLLNGLVNELRVAPEAR